MRPEEGFMNYSGERTLGSLCEPSCNKGVKMNTSHCQGKENQPISIAASTTSHSTSRPGPSNPNSPTVHGLIQLNGRAVKGTSSNNFNVKVCNCKDTISCDHQEVSILTDDQESLGKESHMQSDPSIGAHKCNGSACTCSKRGKTSRSGVSLSNCNSCCCINKRNKGCGRSLQSEASDITNRDVTSIDSNHRWKLPTVNPQEAALVDMGVSMLSCASLNSALSSRNMDSDQSSNNSLPTGCCDGSVIKETNISSPDFFVYKRRRIETPSAPMRHAITSKSTTDGRASQRTLQSNLDSDAESTYLPSDPFEMLSHDAVLHIFRWLPKSALVKCAQVCKRFHPLALESSLWRRLDLNCRALRPGALGRIVLRGCQYLRLSKAELPGAVFSPGLQHLPAFQASLMYLDLSMAVVQPDTVAELLSSCSRLKKVSLEFLTVNEAVMRALALNPALETLNMAMCSGVPSGPLGELCGRSRQLRHLNVAWAGLQNRGLDYLVGVLPPGLESLNIAGCRHYLSDTHVENIVRRLPKLVELDLSDCTELSSLSVKTIVTLENLYSLGLSRCYSIHAESFLELRKISTMRQLSMFGVAEEAGLRRSLADAVVGLQINTQPFSTVARPTVGVRRTSIWTARVRDV